MTRETETAVERARLLCANGYLRDLRDRAGVTLEVVAEIVGTTAPSVNRWEHGLVTPSTRNAARLAEVIDLLEEATTIPRPRPGAPGSSAAVLVNRFRSRPGPRPCLAALDRLVRGDG